MRNYELVCIVQPDLDETAFNEAVDRVKAGLRMQAATSVKWMCGASASLLT